MPALALHGVGKSYGEAVILDQIDLTVEQGSFVALVGPSGSGKTTLLKTINGLSVPDSGAVQIFGEDVAKSAGPELRRRIGYVFQQTGLFPHMTVAENIGIVPRLCGTAEAERDKRSGELLELVGLSRDMAPRFPEALSGGQAQRVGLARALAAKPQIMLMDEPFGALDPVTRDDLGTAYRKLHDALGLTTLLVTHDISEALLLADRVIVLRDGKIHADATPEQLLSGHPDPLVAEMVDVPKRQAARLSQMGTGK